MTISKPNNRARLVSYDHTPTSKTCSLRKKGLSPPSSVLLSCEPGQSAFSRTQSSSSMAHLAKRTVSPTPNVPDKTFDMNPIKGVYFENERIIDTRLYPAQMKYNPFHVTKMPELPVGVPLAKPPRLALTKATKYGEPLSAPTASIARTTPTTNQNSPSIQLKSNENERTKQNPSQHRGHRRIASITNKINVLSKEEKVFLEAAALLSNFRKK